MQPTSWSLWWVPLVWFHQLQHRQALRWGSRDSEVNETQSWPSVWFAWMGKEIISIALCVGYHSSSRPASALSLHRCGFAQRKSPIAECLASRCICVIYALVTLQVRACLPRGIVSLMNKRVTWNNRSVLNMYFQIEGHKLSIARREDSLVLHTLKFHQFARATRALMANYGCNEWWQLKLLILNIKQLSDLSSSREMARWSSGYFKGNGRLDKFKNKLIAFLSQQMFIKFEYQYTTE